MNARSLLALVSLTVASSGCNMGLPDYYGRHEIPQMGASVNGTDVLAHMFTEAGHRVYFRGTLVTDEMASADAIVWFPNDDSAPQDEVCEWLDNWLYEAADRTLVVVGRDFDAAPLYWQTMLNKVDKDQKKYYQQSLLEARARWIQPSGEPPEALDCDWFRYERSMLRDANDLAGPWAEGIDPSKTQIILRSRMHPQHAVQTLLRAGGDALVSQYQAPHWDGSRVILVANGSFLLNYPLANHEHRKLAARLIEDIPAGRTVFLESSPGGPPLDPPYADSSLWTLFGAWPLNAILLQLAVVGVIFCFARWPIFGRPKEPPAESTSDFAKHVDAVGKLLSRSRDRAFAASRVPQPETTAAPALPSRKGNETADDGRAR